MLNFKLGRRSLIVAAVLASTGMLNACSDVPDDRYNVNLRENPKDLRSAVKTIMELENWLLQRIPPNQKIVILIAQEHRTLSHTMLHHALAIAHAEQRKKHPDRRFALGFEIPHNYTDPFLGPDTDGRYATALFSKISISNPLHETLQKIGYYAQQHHISVSFNDIAFTTLKPQLEIIDQDDPLSRDIVRRYAPEYLDKPIYRDPSDGYSRRQNHIAIALSDKMSIKNAFAHMERTNSRIYIPSGGLSHFTGVYRKERFSRGLIAGYREAGAMVIPVLPSAEIYKSRIYTKTEKITNIVNIWNIDKRIISEKTDPVIAGQREERWWNEINRESGYLFTGGRAPQ